MKPLHGAPSFAHLRGAVAVCPLENVETILQQSHSARAVFFETAVLARPAVMCCLAAAGHALSTAPPPLGNASRAHHARRGGSCRLLTAEVEVLLWGVLGHLKTARSI